MDLNAELHKHFGFDHFRPGQRDAVAAAVAGRDLLVVMPTGAGKSLTYQLPALLRDDLTIVVSPLVSLMADQVTALNARSTPGIRQPAALINSQQDAAANAEVIDRARNGDLRLLYVAPERFSSTPFLKAIRAVAVGLFVVDEAHCVSQWGHDFRPDYFRLGDAARWLEAAAIIATTATATPTVAADISARLGLRTPELVTTGFDRPNLSFTVVNCGTRTDKHDRLATTLEDAAARPAIVYAGTRRRCEEVADDLSERLGVQVAAYHAGLDRELRAETQRRFMAGDLDVVVATNAFGMGIDKADVRTVIHETVPTSLEAYYQEAGRAGRDRSPARALLLAEPRDKSLHIFFIDNAAVSGELLDSTAQTLFAAAGGQVNGSYDLPTDRLDASSERVRAIIGHLARAGMIAPTPSTPDRAKGRILAAYDPALRKSAIASADEGGRMRKRQYWSIWNFVEGDSCRRRALLDHFGDPRVPNPEGPCCDCCDPDLVPAPAHIAGRIRVGDGSLDDAIISLVRDARPGIGRTRVCEVLRGSRAKVILRNSWDGLPAYGLFAHLRAADVLKRVDGLLEQGRLDSTGGQYPTLKVAAVAKAAD